VILLDTNVVSELMRAEPDTAVLRWVDRQPQDVLWLASLVAFELAFGIARLPDGDRKQRLSRTLASMLEEDFAGRVLAFDLEASAVCARLCARRQREGKPLALADAQIASICVVHDAFLATRNTADFEHLDVRLVNPWKD
jgi:predicted nucleic acid-binding protein